MYTKPTPQQVREWMQQRQVSKTPLPTMEEIRRQLGWQFFKSAECAR
jgi:predicted dithiol-disulfide oxidoreductase (DUF899 family)